MANPDIPRDSLVKVKVSKAERAKIDRAENLKVKARSGGQCELCGRPAQHVHHKLRGHGVRGYGKSALASQKEHLCVECHVAEHA